MCVPNSKETKKKVLLLELILKVGDGKVISQNYLTNIQHLIQMLLDIGAFIGTHTLALSDSVKNGTVYSFEPQPWAYNAIKYVNKNKIKNVILKSTGISDKKDMIKFIDSMEDQLYVMKKKKKKKC